MRVLRAAEDRGAANDEKEQSHSASEKNGWPFFRDEELFGGCAITGAQKSFEEKQRTTTGQSSNDKREKGYLKDALRDDEGFEGHGERGNRRAKNRGHRVLF